MAVDPLSSATRLAKRNLLLFASAAILVKTFNLTIEKVPISVVVVSMEKGALAFVIVSALIYFLISFLLYYWIDFQNIESSPHQTAAEEDYKKRQSEVRWKIVYKIEKEAQSLAPEGSRVVVDNHAVFRGLEAVEILGRDIDDSFFKSHQHGRGPIRLIKSSPDHYGDFHTLDVDRNVNAYSPIINLTKVAISRYRYSSILYRVFIVIPVMMTRLLYVIRNFGMDGLFPIALGLIAILNIYGVINLDWVLTIMPPDMVE